MAQALDRWLARYFGQVTEEGDHAKTVMLTSGDGSTTWDTWEIEPGPGLENELKVVADGVEKTLQALRPELPKKRHTFLVRVLDNQARVLGQTPKSVTGESAEGGIQASSVDAAAMAMKSISELWKTSLDVAGAQIQQMAEEREKYSRELLACYESEITRKKVEADSTLVTSQQTEKLVGIFEENLPHILEMAKYYMAKKKGQLT